MTGLTATQQWTHDHIARCQCGAWLVLTDRELKRRAQDFPPAPCKHIPRALENRAA